MARPKTKGDALCFRLPIEADAELRRRATRDGMTVAEWLEAKLTPQFVDKTSTPSRPEESATNPATLPPPPPPPRTAAERRGPTPMFRE